MPIAFQDRSIFIFMFMLICSMSLFAIEEIMLKPMGIDLQSPTSDSVGNKRTSQDIAALIDESQINERTTNILRATNGTDSNPGFDRIVESPWSAAYVTFEILQLISGNYVFNLLLWFGVPDLYVVIVVVAYNIMIVVTIIKYLTRSG